MRVYTFVKQKALQTNVGIQTGPYHRNPTLSLMFARMLCKRVWSFEGSARFFSSGRVWPWIEPAGEETIKELNKRRVPETAGK